MNLNIETLASTTATTSPKSQAFAESFWNNTVGKMIAWFADATNGIQKFFAKEVNTEKLCVSDSTGETCITKAQLDALISGAGNTGAGGGDDPSLPDSSGSPTSSSIDETEPVITIAGDNPAVIIVGTSYVDLGATVTDTDENGVVNNNLGIQYNVNGVDVSEISLDTSTTTVHTIIYKAVDGAGNAGTAIRTVEVVE